MKIRQSPSRFAPRFLLTSSGAHTTTGAYYSKFGSLFGLIAASLLAPAKLESAPVKLNDLLPAGGNVHSHQISPDGQYVVYRADQDNDGDFELFSVPIKGGTVVKLNDPLVTGGDIDSYQISSESSRVIYRADQETLNVPELYSVPIGGGGVAKLNGTLQGGNGVRKAELSPDGSRVVFVAPEAGNTFPDELFSIPTAGGTPTKLNGTLPSGGEVESHFEITPDGTRVVYAADQDTAFQIELYVAPIAGGGSTRLVDITLSNGDITASSISISPDSNHAVYLAIQDTFPVRELYSVLLSGGATQKLSNPILSGGSISPFLLEFSPDSSRFIYSGDLDTLGVEELYSASVAGGGSVKLNAPLAFAGDVEDVVQFTTDGSEVIYLAQQDSAARELYRVPVAGGTTPVKLNDTITPGGQVFFGSRWLSPDGSRVVYIADQDDVGTRELYSVPFAGGTSTKLNGPLTFNNGSVSSFDFTGDGANVIYRASSDFISSNELFRVPIAGGTAVKLNTPLASGGVSGVTAASSTPDGFIAVYQIQESAGEATELYSTEIVPSTAWQTNGGDWDLAGNWEAGILPDGSIVARIDIAAIATISGGDVPHLTRKLLLGGGAGASVVELRDGATLTAIEGIALSAGAVLRGEGVVSTSGGALAIPSGAEMAAGGGDRLRITSGAATNAGRIEALGNAFAVAEVDFDGTLTNASDTGFIAAHDATLRLRGGLHNAGALSITGGFNDVFGEITNDNRIIISGGATAIFYDDVTNNGVVHASASGVLQSLVAFFGDFSGNGVSGGGHVFIEGDSRPGFSPGTMSFGGDLSYGPFAGLRAELAGTAQGDSYDQLDVAGHLTLDGALEVTLIDGFVPAAGDVFDLWDAGTVSGGFNSVALPALPTGLFWHSWQIDTTGEIRVGLVPESYQTFATNHGLSAPAGGDDDADGVPNVLEYVFTSDPTDGDSINTLPTLMRTDSEHVLAFTMASPAGADVILTIEGSVDLDLWEPLATRAPDGTWSGAVPVTVSPDGSGLADITLVSPASPPRRFYRIAVELVAP